ncbi:hypothetical protein KOI35_37975 [Actinoplanes bogorensis]|uniref:Secreted protein n=1 Tax=Paractinoplanes bogorensis TaxID=1610840 RepID=A0ABS5Z1C8_9ACTN|nr:hypothetical protein [Actinoplanes bogorensis]MBU2669316.1 hypothetical protein [Actinoplanes bogorensis]
MRRIAVIAAAIFLSTVGLAAPASAAPGDPAYNLRTYRLSDTPNEGNRSCFSSRIYLAAHNYARHLQIDGVSVDYHSRYSGSLFLGAGNYTWTECLQGTRYRTYIHSQSLDPDNPAWNTSTWSYEFDVQETSCINCQYSWGGKLYWI